MGAPLGRHRGPVPERRTYSGCFDDRGPHFQVVAHRFQAVKPAEIDTRIRILAGVAIQAITVEDVHGDAVLVGDHAAAVLTATRIKTASREAA